MLTDEQGLRLIESMRTNTQNTGVRALCEWVLALAQAREAAVATTAPKADRRAYMREYMKRRREAQKRRCSPRFP